MISILEPLLPPPDSSTSMVSPSTQNFRGDPNSDDSMTSSPSLNSLILLLVLWWGRLVRPDRREEHANLPLILLVLRVFPRRDQLGQPSRPLKQHNQGSSTDASEAVEVVGGVTAPLVKGKPDCLLGKEIRVSAVREQAGSAEPSLKILLAEALAKFTVVFVGVLGFLECCRFY